MVNVYFVIFTNIQLITKDFLYLIIAPRSTDMTLRIRNTPNYYEFHYSASPNDSQELKELLKIL